MASDSERQSQQEEGNHDRNRQVPAGKNNTKQSLRQADIRVIRNMMKSGRRMNDITGFCMKRVLRRVLQEELPPIIERHRHLFPCANQSETSGCRALRLCFTNRLPRTIFTHTRITSEDGGPLGIALCDSTSQNCIVKEGPLSCTRIMMYALNGEFGSDGNEDWSAENFNANISPHRENKGQLLIGNKVITLENGVGLVSNIEFSDNSRWTRSRTFRLGAKVVQINVEAINNIREARSEAVVVMDKRGEPYKKRDRPLLSDEIWRLKRIAKDGKIHKLLLSHQVKTVKDVLQLHTTNPRMLQKITDKMIAKKSWDTIIEHAQTCDIDDGKRYIYHCPTPTAEKSIALIFNSIYKLLEVSFDGRSYRNLHSLNLEEKRVVERAKQNAYENLKDLMPVDISTYGAGLHIEQLNLFPSAAEKGQPSTSRSSFVGEIIHEDDDQVGAGIDNNIEMLLDNTATSRGEQFNMCGEVIDDIGDGYNSFLAGSQNFEFENYNYVSSPLLGWGIGNIDPFGLPCGEGTDFCYQYSSVNNSTAVISTTGKRKSTFWRKLRNALKLVIPFVAKKKARLRIPCKDVTIN